MKKNVIYNIKARNTIVLFCVSNLIIGTSVWAQDITITTEGSTRSSAYGVQNKIVTVARNDKLYTYFGFLEEVPQSTILHDVKILEYEHSTDTKRYVHVGQTEELDAGGGGTLEPHGTPSLTLDSDGFLHVVYGPHYDDVKYRKSNQSLFSHSLNLVSETIIPHLKSTDDLWTYPIIKTDDSKTLHVAGSLDATNDNKNVAKDIGYVRKKVNDLDWTYPLNSTDPVHVFSPNYKFVRYDVMMNVDDNGKIHLLAPDTNAESNWKLDYTYFTSTNGGSSFTDQGLVWEHDLSKSMGWGNIAFDASNNPHFTMQAGNSELSEHIYYNYYNGQNWIKEELGLQNKYVHRPKLRIDDFGSLFMTFYSTDVPGWTGQNSTLYLGFKNLNDPNANISFFSYRNVYGHLIWMPTIEEREPYVNLDKNWFHMMWQENDNGINGAIQKVYADLVVPNDFEVPLRTFKRYTDFRAGDLLSVAKDYNSSHPTKRTIFDSTSNTNLIAGGKIVLHPGSSVKTGAKFNAKINVSLEGFDVQANLSSKSQRIQEIENNPVVETDLTSKGVLIFPNPSEGMFYINLPEKLISKETRIEIFDGIGRRVRTQSLGQKQNTIQTDSFGNGTYYLVITNKDQKIVKQILINN